MEDTTRTGIGNYIQTCMYLGVTPEILPFTTLNQKLNINESVTPTAEDRFALNYFCIGIGGHKWVTGAGSVPLLSTVRHAATDRTLYNMLPFVVRPLNNDVTDAERANLALRTVITDINDEQKIAYYARRLNKTGVAPTMRYHKFNKGNEVVTPWVPGSDDFDAEPKDKGAGGVVSVGGDMISVFAEMGINLNANEISEIINAATQIHGDPAYAIISEIGFCTGFNKHVNTNIGGVTVSMNEAMCVQIASFLSTMVNLNTSNNSLKIDMDVGAGDPVYNLVTA